VIYLNINIKMICVAESEWSRGAGVVDRAGTEGDEEAGEPGVGIEIGTIQLIFE
jgi:hypothetical protein